MNEQIGEATDMIQALKTHTDSMKKYISLKKPGALAGKKAGKV